MLNKLVENIAQGFSNISIPRNIKSFGQDYLVQFMPGHKYEGQEDYVTLVKNGFNRNSHVFACVDYRCRAFAAARWYIYRKTQSGDKKILLNDPRNYLFVEPNETNSWNEFAYEWLANVLLAGENYTKMADTFGMVSSLWNLRPYRVRVNVGRTPQDIVSYTFGQNLPTEFTIPGDKIIQEKTLNPLDPFHGLSRIRIASLQIDQSNFGREWNAQFMQNSGKPDGMFSFEGGDLTEEQRLAFKREIHRKFSGKDNAGKPLVGGGKWHYTPLTMPAKDMEWINTMKMTNGDICTIFQVPAMLIGDSDNKTYQNYGEARKHFSEDVTVYDLERMKHTLNRRILTREEKSKGYCIDYDVSHLPAYKESENDLVDRLAKRTWWTDNEKREAEGKEPVEGGDELTKPQPAFNNQNDNGKDKEKDPKKKSFQVYSVLNLQTKTQKEFYFKQFDGERMEFSKAVMPIIQKQFKRELKGIQKAIKNSGNPDDLTSQISGYLDQHSEQWEAIFDNITKGVGSQFARRTLNSLKSLPRNMEYKADDDIAKDGSRDEIERYVREITANKVKGINTTTLDKIKDIINEGLTDSWTMGQYQKGIDKLYLESIIPNRSEVIARTEVIQASNLGSQAMAKSSGILLEKEWSDLGDHRVRASHKSMDGQRVPLESNWSIDGRELQFPGDSSLGAKAKDTIQCRCIELYHEIGTTE